MGGKAGVRGRGQEVEMRRVVSKDFGGSRHWEGTSGERKKSRRED